MLDEAAKEVMKYNIRNFIRWWMNPNDKAKSRGKNVWDNDEQK